MTDPIRAPRPTPPRAPPAGPADSARRTERRQRALGWRSRDILRAAALVLGLFFALKVLWLANELVLVAFLGVLFGLALAAGVDRLERKRMPRGLAAAFIVIAFFAALYGLGAAIAPTIALQVQELRTKLPQSIDRVDIWIHEQHGGILGTMLNRWEGNERLSADSARAATAGPARSGSAPAPAPSDTVPSAQAPGPLRMAITHEVGGVAGHLFPFITSTLAVLFGLLVILFIAVYTAVEPDLYQRGVMHLFPHRSRERAGAVMTEIAYTLRRWLLTQLVAMAAIAIVTSIVLLILQVRAALALGVIAGLLEFIPFVGPILSGVPSVAMGFLDSPQKALWVLIAFVAIQQAEGHLLIPLLMRGGMSLPPVLTILAQALMALLFGFLGLMVAVPLLAVVMVPAKMLYVEDVVGDDIPLLSGEHDEDPVDT